MKNVTRYSNLHDGGRKDEPGDYKCVMIRPTRAIIEAAVEAFERHHTQKCRDEGYQRLWNALRRRQRARGEAGGRGRL